MGVTNLDELELGGVPVIPGVDLFSGRYIYVDAVSGSDGNPGTSSLPVATLTQAYSLGRDGYNDVIIIKGRPTTSSPTAGTIRLSAQLAWAKSALHLFGMAAPALNQRARISTASDATTNIANLVSVTGQGCVFANFSLFQGVGQAATAEQLWQDAGQRNYYSNVFFGGMGSANGAAHADSYTLKLYGGSENVFDNCYFGTDTQSRDAANTNVLLAANATPTGATRNVFRNCTFAAYATDTDPTFINCNASGSIDRFALFDRCTFINSGTSALAAVVDGHASQGGVVLFKDCTATGVSEWGDLSNNAAIKVSGPVPNGNTSGIAVNSNPS